MSSSDLNKVSYNIEGGCYYDKTWEGNIDRVLPTITQTGPFKGPGPYTYNKHIDILMFDCI